MPTPQGCPNFYIYIKPSESNGYPNSFGFPNAILQTATPYTIS